MITFIVASALIVPLANSLQNLLNFYGFIVISYLNITFKVFLLMFLFSFALSVIGSVIPIYRFSRKKPIDVIRN